MEIKRLNAAIATLRSELNKYEEQLEDFKKYKDFLDSITPNEWFEQLQRRKELRKLVLCFLLCSPLVADLWNAPSYTRHMVLGDDQDFHVAVLRLI